MKHFPFVLLVVAGCAAGPTPSEYRTAEAGRTPYLAPPAATEGIRLAWEERESPGLADLVDQYARVTGQTVLMTADTRQVLEKKQLVKAGGADVLEIPAADVQEVTEALLIMHQFVMLPIHGGEPRMVQIMSLETQERNFVRRSAIYVPADELESWRARPAALITTSLRLDNVDVRQLSNSMRTMLTDANTQQIVPVGNSNSLILTGFGNDVVALADLLHVIDAQSKPAEPAEPAGAR